MGQMALQDRSHARVLHKRALLRACAFAALASLPAIAVATPPLDAGFQGHMSIVSGIVNRTATSQTTETITIGSSAATLNWTPFDQQIGGGTIDFLPTANVATFTSAPGVNDYTVLNRIVPADPTRAIAFNGQVISTLQGTDAIGGRIWFYSPGGIVIGATAVFDVGSLLLTTNEVSHSIPFSVTFTAPESSKSTVQIMPGAQINALQPGSYVALIAPRIEQGGTVRVNGSAAYVAGEQVTMTVNQGLFDIQVDVGTTDPNGIVHTGETSGPANSVLADDHSITMVAVPKNQALTMLLGGTIGFDAGDAEVQNGQIVLKSGDGITFTGGNVTSSLTATAAGSVFVKGNVDFETSASGDSITINAAKNIEVNTDTGSLRIHDSANQVAGTLALNAANVWIADQAILTQLEANPNYAGRDAALAVNSGVTNLDGFVGADSVAIGVSNSLFGQNSGTADNIAGITVGAGGFSIANTGATPATVNVYGRQVIGGSTVTGIAFMTAANLTGSFVSGSTINGCEIGTDCAPPAQKIVVPWLNGVAKVTDDSKEDRKDVDVVIDVSELSGGADDDLVEAGVTSGSDSSAWDPINVDSKP